MCTENDRKQDQFRIHACILYNDFLVFRVVFVFFRGFIGLFSVFRVISVSFRGFTGFCFWVYRFYQFLWCYTKKTTTGFTIYIYIYQIWTPKP